VPKDTHRTATTDHAQLELPEQVMLAVAELAGAAREGLLALAGGHGPAGAAGVDGRGRRRLVGLGTARRQAAPAYSWLGLPDFEASSKVRLCPGRWQSLSTTSAVSFPR
jgi:hypothetical protein